jgi:hypothetical protein
VVSAYTIILSLAFQNLTTKATASKEFYLKQRMFWISKNLHSNTVSHFNKEISKPNVLPKQTLVWCKNNFQKGGFSKSFVPFKNSWPVSNVLKTLLLFQNVMQQDASNPCLCP